METRYSPVHTRKKKLGKNEESYRVSPTPSDGTAAAFRRRRRRALPFSSVAFFLTRGGGVVYFLGVSDFSFDAISLFYRVSTAGVESRWPSAVLFCCCCCCCCYIFTFSYFECTRCGATTPRCCCCCCCCRFFSGLPIGRWPTNHGRAAHFSNRPAIHRPKKANRAGRCFRRRPEHVLFCYFFFADRLLFFVCFFFWRPRQSKTNDQFRRHFWTGSISAGKNLTTQRPRLVRKRRFRTPKRQKKKRNALEFHRPSRTNQERPMRTGRRNLLPSPSPLRRRRRRRRRRKRRVARLANDQRGPTASQTFQPMKIEFKWQPIGRRDGPERSSRRRRRAQTEPKQKRNDHGAKGRPGSGHRPVPKQKTVESGQCKLSSSSSSLLREAHFTVVWLTS